MDTDFHERVRLRAHQLWLQEGCPEGRGSDHWRQAERDVLESMDATPALADQPIDANPPPAGICTVEQPKAEVISAPEACDLAGAGDLPTPSTHLHKKGTSLLKVGLRQCRYIISETYSPAICCGARTNGGSWCEEHRARVLVRVPVRASSHPNQRQPSTL